MNHSTVDDVELAIALATLVHQLGGNGTQESLRACLLEVCDIAARRDVEYSVIAGTLCANGAVVTAPAESLAPLIEAAERHDVAVFRVESLASPKELLLLANLLSEPSPGPTHRIDLRVQELGCWHVSFTVAHVRDEVMAQEEASSNGPVRPTVSAALACATVDDACVYAEGLTEQLQLYAFEMDAVQTANLLLDVLRTERDCAALGDSHDEVRAVWSATFDQLASASILQLIAQLLPGSEVPKANVLAVLQRAGDAGAGALIARLISESGRAERRALFDAIVEMGAGFPLLLRSLQHPTWYVVRNAASLLGAMRASNAEAALAQTLTHADERVRLAAVTALTKIGTPAACAAMSVSMRDRSVNVRHRAFRSLLTLQGTGISANAVGDALEMERSEAMQREMLDALVASGSADAVQKLVRLCSPSARGTFSAEMRITMLESLVQLRPSTAMPLLRMAGEDRDPAVRTRARELMAKPVPATATA